jgi:hypothetical protein
MIEKKCQEQKKINKDLKKLMLGRQQWKIMLSTS